jgi:hypothetical protein
MGDKKFLSQFSTEELEKEIALRKLTKPNRASEIDWSPIISLVEDQMTRIEKGEGGLKDFEHWLFEAVMEAMYGDTIWQWWNRHQ